MSVDKFVLAGLVALGRVCVAGVGSSVGGITMGPRLVGGLSGASVTGVVHDGHGTVAPSPPTDIQCAAHNEHRSISRNSYPRPFFAAFSSLKSVTPQVVPAKEKQSDKRSMLAGA